MFAQFVTSDNWYDALVTRASWAWIGSEGFLRCVCTFWAYSFIKPWVYSELRECYSPQCSSTKSTYVLFSQIYVLLKTMYKGLGWNCVFFSTTYALFTVCLECENCRRQWWNGLWQFAIKLNVPWLRCIRPVAGRRSQQKMKPHLWSPPFSWN